MQGMKTTLNIAGERVTVTAFGDETCAGFGDASVAPTLSNRACRLYTCTKSKTKAMPC